jgi:hypothetical protein
VEATHFAEGGIAAGLSQGKTVNRVVS